MKKIHFLFYNILIFVVSMSFSQSKVPQYVSTLKPEVYMGMPNLKDLANTSDYDKWEFIQDHLDGFWVNGAGTGSPNIVNIVTPCTTRNFIFVAPLTQRSPTFELSGGYYTFYNDLLNQGFITTDPSIAVVNDYITKQASDPQRYYMDPDLPSTTTFLENNNPSGLGSPFGERYYLTTRHGSFVKDIFNPVSDPNDPIVGQSYNTMLLSTGVVYERAAKKLMESTDFQESYIQAFNLAREHGKDFAWLCPRGNDGTIEELIQGLADAYTWMEANKIFPDKIVLANYTRQASQLPMFPMVDASNPNGVAPTFTGILRWLIQQRQTNSENLLSNANFNSDAQWFGQPSTCYNNTAIRYDATSSNSHTNDGSGSWIIQCSNNNARIRNSNLVTTPNTVTETDTYQVSAWVKRETTNGEEARLRIFLTEPGPTPSVNIESTEGDFTTTNGDWTLVTMTFEGVKRNTEYYINFNKKNTAGVNADQLRVDDVRFFLSNSQNLSAEIVQKKENSIIVNSQNNYTISTEDTFTKIEIYNIFGQNVLSASDVKSVSLANLTNGVYIIKANINQEIYSQKIIKQ